MSLWRTFQLHRLIYMVMANVTETDLYLSSKDRWRMRPDSMYKEAVDTNVILLTLAHPQPLFFYAYLQSFQSFVTKVNDNPKNTSKCTLNDFRFFAKINDSLGNR